MPKLVDSLWNIDQTLGASLIEYAEGASDLQPAFRGEGASHALIEQKKISAEVFGKQDGIAFAPVEEIELGIAGARNLCDVEPGRRLADPLSNERRRGSSRELVVYGGRDVDGAEELRKYIDRADEAKIVERRRV